MKKYHLLLLSLISLFSCRTPSRDAIKATSLATAHGRTVIDKDGGILLIGPASYVEFNFVGSCTVWVKNIAPWNNYNYVVFSIDGSTPTREKIEGSFLKSHAYISDDGNTHTMRIYKATETLQGMVLVKCIEGEKLSPTPSRKQKKIEFIGNSITCGTGSDIQAIPCNTNKWYDQHNAYLSYASRVARALDADYMLSAVSGIGVYRTWNAEGPSMPDVYEHTWLSKDNPLRWDFNRFTPDVVSIELGTNDLAENAGRAPFDSTTFIKKYVAFISTIYGHYPHTRIALLSSPMVSGAKNELLLACLKNIQATANANNPTKPTIEILAFTPMQTTGCGGHPTVEEQATMAEQATPFFKHLLEQTN